MWSYLNIIYFNIAPTISVSLAMMLIRSMRNEADYFINAAIPQTLQLNTEKTPSLQSFIQYEIS